MCEEEAKMQLGALCLGDLEVNFDANGAFARSIRLRGEEIFRGIGLVARDSNWATPALEASPDLSRYGDEFYIECKGALAHADQELDWSLRWVVREDGLEARMKASSKAGFRTNRTGFVVLHSLGAARGRPVRITHPDESDEDAAFPDLVSPHQPFFDIAGMAYETPAGHAVSIAFEGEVFETEDQRNWTDASYKTYCRPLGRPFPYTIGSEGVTQIVRVRFRPAPASGRAEAAPTPALGPSLRLPAIGTGSPPGTSPATLADALQRLAPALTAIEIDPATPDAIAEARARIAAVKGDLRVDVRDGPEEATTALLQALAPILAERPNARVALWDRNTQTIKAMRDLLPAIPIGGGTGAFFTELNRMEAPAHVDFLSWTTNPTVHGFDDDTIGETTEPLGDILRTASARWPRQTLEIGPATLGFRYNPNATSPQGRARAAPPDPRQGLPIGAAWMLGTLCGFLHEHLASLCFFEPTGPKGLINADGRLTPAGHLFQRLTHLEGVSAQRVTWSGQPRCQGLLLASGDETMLAGANLQAVAATIPGPEGVWTNVEILGQEGFEPSKLGVGGAIDLPGYSVAWVA
jgi:hypothetical protein